MMAIVTVAVDAGVGVGVGVVVTGLFDELGAVDVALAHDAAANAATQATTAIHAGTDLVDLTDTCPSINSDHRTVEGRRASSRSAAPWPGASANRRPRRASDSTPPRRRYAAPAESRSSRCGSRD